MKKILIGITVLSIIVLTLGVAGYVYAQGQTTTPDYPYGPGMMEGYDGYNGYGMMGYGQGMMGAGMMGWDGDEGPMHEAMIGALAEALGLSAEEVEARHDAGETLWDIAEAEGLNDDEIRELMFTAHDTALAEAVQDGWLSQGQADWMDEHMEQMWDDDYGHCDGDDRPGPGARWHGMSW